MGPARRAGSAAPAIAAGRLSVAGKVDRHPTIGRSPHVPTASSVSRVVPHAVAPGSTLIQGHSNQSMIVEQQDGIVVVKGALNDARRSFAGKPIRYVTASHHHSDHAGGMRPFVAVGARPVVHVNSVPVFRRVLASRGSRLLPDRLDRSEAAANILGVPGSDAVTLPDRCAR